MKFKNTRKTLAAILSVLTMMPNCYQLGPGKTAKAKRIHSKQKKGNTSFLSKNTTMTTGERIGENLLFSVFALLTGGFLFSKCGGNTSPSLQIDPANVEKKDYGYVIENSIARVVLFPATDSDGDKKVYMMYELKRPETLACLPSPTKANILKNSLRPIEFNDISLGATVDESTAEFDALILHLTGVPHEQTCALLNALDTSRTFPTFDSAPLSDINSTDVLAALRVAITFEFGSSISEVSAWYTQQLAALKETAPPDTCELLDTLDELPPPVATFMTAHPPCSFACPLINAGPLARSISNILVDHAPCIFSPRHYFLLSSSLRRLNSFAYILQNTERCDNVLKALPSADNQSTFWAPDALTASHFSDPKALYNYIMSAGSDTFIANINTKKQKSAYALCTAILSNSRDLPTQITDANAATVESTALNLALGTLVLDPTANPTPLYAAISESATAASSRVDARDILTSMFTALKRPLATLRTLAGSSASLPYGYPSALADLTSTLTAAQSLLANLSLTRATDTRLLPTLKTTIASLLRLLSLLSNTTNTYSRTPASSAADNDPLFAHLQRLNGDFLSASDTLIATQQAIDAALAAGARLTNTFATAIQSLNAMRSSLSTLCVEKKPYDTTGGSGTDSDTDSDTESDTDSDTDSEPDSDTDSDLATSSIHFARVEE